MEQWETSKSLQTLPAFTLSFTVTCQDKKGKPPGRMLCQWLLLLYGMYETSTAELAY